MINRKKILAIVPARSGSKGIKNKNLKKINGKSLVFIAGQFLSKIKQIDLSIISTDSEKIATSAINSGLKFLSFRHRNLSGDKVSDIKVLVSCLKEIEKKKKTKFDIVVMIHPTSPLRRTKDVLGAIKLLIKKNYDSVWTVSETDLKYHPLKQMVFKKGKLRYYSKNGSRIFSRQQLNKVYHRNGVAYVIKANLLRNHRKIINNNTGAYLIRTKQISIDTLKDLRTASKFMRN